MKFTGVKDEAMELEVLKIITEVVQLAKRPAHIVNDTTLRHGLTRAIAQGKQREDLAVLHKLTVDFSTRMKSTAGRAWVHQAKVALHYRLLKDNPEQLRSTMLHELAHILAGYWYGYNCHHDANWKQVAILLGDDGGRCHSMDTSAYRAKEKRYDYRCACRLYSMSQRRHTIAEASKARNDGREHYRCKICKTALAYLGRGPQ